MCVHLETHVKGFKKEHLLTQRDLLVFNSDIFLCLYCALEFSLKVCTAAQTQINHKDICIHDMRTSIVNEFIVHHLAQY